MQPPLLRLRLGTTVVLVYNDCYKCPPPRNYDSQEVVKQTKDIDHSRIIETQSVVPSKRLIETNSPDHPRE